MKTATKSAKKKVDAFDHGRTEEDDYLEGLYDRIGEKKQKENLLCKFDELFEDQENEERDLNGGGRSRSGVNLKMF